MRVAFLTLSLCLMIALQSIDVTNVCDVLHIADVYSAEGLLHAALNFLVHHWKDVQVLTSSYLIAMVL